MALIQHITSGQLVVLSFHHIFGRNPLLSTSHHPNLDVSRSHATIFWQSGQWFVKDHSRNGTLLSGELLRNNVKKLVDNSWIQFGSEHDTKWKIINLDAPVSYLAPENADKSVIFLSECNALPNETSLELQLLYSFHEHRWQIDQNGYLANIESGEKIFFDNTHWEFIENTPLSETQNTKSIEELYFLFQLSKDEEHIQLSLVVSSELTLDLGSKSSYYLLLALGRKRIEDKTNGLASEDQGWIYIEDLLNDLSKELGKEVDVYYLNLQIFRIRKQFLDYQSYGVVFGDLIQRRTGSIRFGHPYLKIMKDSKVAGELLPA